MAAPSCAAPVKVFVFFSTILMTLIGSVVVFMGARARFSSNFHKLSIFMSVQSNDFVSSELMVLVIIGLVCLAILCGCWGLMASLAERQCTLCGIGSVGLIIGMLLMIGSLTVHMVVRSQGPIILKFVNRLCGPGEAGVMKLGLGCSKAHATEEDEQASSLAQPITSSTTTTSSIPAAPSTTSSIPPAHSTTSKAAGDSTESSNARDSVSNSHDTSSKDAPAADSRSSNAAKDTTAGNDELDAGQEDKSVAKEDESDANGEAKSDATEKDKAASIETDNLDAAEQDKKDAEKEKLGASEKDEQDASGKDKSSASKKRTEGFRRLQPSHVLSWMTAPSITEFGLAQTGFASRLLSRATVSFVLAAEARQMSLAMQGSGRVTESSNQSRRLFPGITEESFLVRSCSRLGPKLCPSTCHLLDQICQEPPGFNPWTACVCDRSGPRIASNGRSGLAQAECPTDKDHPMCQMDVTGRHMGVLCMSPTPDLGGSADAAAEACFVLPSTKCSAGTTPPDCIASGSACISTGPCSNPDSRSQLYVEGREMALRFAAASGMLGMLTVLMSLCVCCLCAELHTGRSTLDQAKSLGQNEPMPFEDEDDLLPLQGE